MERGTLNIPENGVATVMKTIKLNPPLKSEKGQFKGLLVAGTSYKVIICWMLEGEQRKPLVFPEAFAVVALEICQTADDVFFIASGFNGCTEITIWSFKRSRKIQLIDILGYNVNTIELLPQNKYFQLDSSTPYFFTGNSNGSVVLRDGVREEFKL